MSSPTMSTRPISVSLSKCSSSENVLSKSKEDRNRSISQKAHNRQRQENTFGQRSSLRHSSSNNGRTSSNFEKQPRSHSSAKGLGGRRNQVKMEQRNEFSPLSVENQGSRKANLNHLLNFRFDSSLDDHMHSSSPSNFKGKPYWAASGNGAVFNKERFMQANCQLIVKAGPDYSAHLVDADLPMDWNLVEKVNMWSPEVPFCPICLYSPCAAHITKCGHIYCLPCILHYLHPYDDPGKKCPICHEAVRKADLKSVSVHKEQQYCVQNIVAMRLMKRKKCSALALPVADADVVDKNVCKYSGCAATSVPNQRNMKYLIADIGQIVADIVQVEMEQLDYKLAVETELEAEEKHFIIESLESCRLRRNALLKVVATEASLESSDAKAIGNEAKEAVDDTHSPSKVSINNNHQTSSEGEQLNDEPSSSSGTSAEHYYYFYQAKDGQHIYLHPINVRCLLHQYGSFSRCPLEISAKILESEAFTMNEATRKRHRFLNHLPLTLEFHVAELDLRPPTITRATLDTFRDQLDRRAAQRKRKARDEKRMLRKVQNEELRKQGKYPSARISLESRRQFPQIPTPSSPGSFSVLLPSPGTTPSDSFLSSHEAHSDEMLGHQSFDDSPQNSSVSSAESAGPSFAQMLKSSKSNEQISWSRLTPAAVNSQALSVASPGNADESVNDPDYVAPPTYQSAFGDALSGALSQLEKNSLLSAQPAGRTAPSARKKKGGKKNKHILLFSTAGQHHQ